MIPEKFQDRMKELLGDDYGDFMSTLDRPAIRGMRVNRAKISPEDFFEICPFEIEPLSYVNEGAILKSNEQIGASAEHHAGMIYMQDPGAMAALASVKIKEDFRVCDLCAAPGGKSTQAAAFLGNDGFLLANEYVPKRAKILVSNIERLGIKNAVVTSLDTAQIAKMYSSFFDLVICDAPCSGEGMFRKYDVAKDEWSEENVKICAKRQKEILENAARLVKPLGYLLYSTCTYSEEENEATVAAFLSNHKEFECIELNENLKCVTSGAVLREGYPESMKNARRFYPHKCAGEGQFIALLQKHDNGEAPTILYKDSTKPLTKEESSIVNAFLRENLTELPKGRLAKQGENIVLISHGCPIPPLSVFMSGVLVGEIRGKILHPSHQFFTTYGKLFRLREELSADGDGRTDKYLLGEEIDAKKIFGSGYCTLLYHGVPIGGGKLSSGRIKNHYPKGLRNKNN